MESHFPDMPPVKPDFVREEKAQVSAGALRQPQAYSKLLTPSVASAQHDRPGALSVGVNQDEARTMALMSWNPSGMSALPTPFWLTVAPWRRQRPRCRCRTKPLTRGIITNDSPSF
jgi:hypothetical protein